MVRSYIWHVTGFWIIKNDIPADNLAEYDSFIENMKASAIHFGDLDALKIAFEYILLNSDINTESLTDSDYPWDNEEVRKIIHYAWEKIWPNSSIHPEKLSNVKLVDIPINEWREQNMKLKHEVI